MGEVAYNSYWDRGDYLLFEDESGMGQAFGPALQKVLIQQVKAHTKPLCIVLAAGHSLEFGKLLR